MKKIYQIVIAFFFLIIGILIIIYYEEILIHFNLNRLLVDTIIINVFVYIGRTLLIRLTNFVLKAKILRFIITLIINIIWIGFLFVLIFVLSPEYGIAIVSFLILAISLTFRDRINNIASGIMILLSNTIKVGDLIETNDVQGIVSEITLNYTKIKNFMGIETYIPNTNVYNSSIKKFTQSLSTLSNIENGEAIEEKEKSFVKYTKKIKQIVTKEGMFTRYLMIVEVPFNVNPNDIDNRLEPVFKKYEKILGISPYYYINKTLKDRVSISLQILARNSELIVVYKNKFMKDILYHLIPEEILLGSEYNSIEELEKNGVI